MKTGKDRPAQQPPKPRCVHRMLEGQCAICADLAQLKRGTVPLDGVPAGAKGFSISGEAKIARPATASTTTATAPTTKAGQPAAPMADRLRAAARKAEERRGTTTAMASTPMATRPATAAKGAVAAPSVDVSGPPVASNTVDLSGPPVAASAILHTAGEESIGRPLCERCKVRPSSVPGPRAAIHAPPVATKDRAEAENAAEAECSKFCTTCRGNATQKAKERIAAKEGVDKKTRRPRNPWWSEVAAILAEPYQPMASRPPRRGVVSSAPGLAAVAGLAAVEHPARDPDLRAAARKAWPGSSDPSPEDLGDSSSADPSAPAPSDSSDLVGATAPVLHSKGEDTRVLCRSVGRSKIAPANEVTCPDCLALLEVEADPGQVMTVELEAGAISTPSASPPPVESRARWSCSCSAGGPYDGEERYDSNGCPRCPSCGRALGGSPRTPAEIAEEEEEDRKIAEYVASEQATCPHSSVPDDGTGEGVGCCRACGAVTSATTPPRLRRVIVESPFKGNVRLNEAYARRAMADCLRRGEAPFASHLLYTQPGVLRDEVEGERALGIEAGLVWGDEADATVVYIDLGISGGMVAGIDRAKADGRPVEMRQLLPEDLSSAFADAEHAPDRSFVRDLLNEARKVIDAAGFEAVPLVDAISRLVAERAEAMRQVGNLALVESRLRLAEARVREIDDLGLGVRHDPDADPQGGKTWVAFIDGVTEAPGEVPTAAVRELRARLVREWTSTEHTSARIRILEEELRKTEEDCRRQDKALEAFERPPVSASGFDFQNVVTFLLASGIYGRTWPEMRKAILEEKLRDIALSTGFV